MDYSKIVPSRELCERMAELGICQTDLELFYCYDQDNHKIGWELAYSYNKDYKNIKAVIAPTLSRMLEGLPKNGYSFVIQPFSDVWYIRDLMTRLDVEDKHLPNAVAKALIALKEQSNGKG